MNTLKNLCKDTITKYNIDYIYDTEDLTKCNITKDLFNELKNESNLLEFILPKKECCLRNFEFKAQEDKEYFNFDFSYRCKECNEISSLYKCKICNQMILDLKKNENSDPFHDFGDIFGRFYCNVKNKDFYPGCSSSINTPMTYNTKELFHPYKFFPIKFKASTSEVDYLDLYDYNKKDYYSSKEYFDQFEFCNDIFKNRLKVTDIIKYKKYLDKDLCGEDDINEYWYDFSKEEKEELKKLVMKFEYKEEYKEEINFEQGVGNLFIGNCTCCNKELFDYICG